jgi:glycosyltransferase involved in cell wall biosynthesis
MAASPATVLEIKAVKDNMKKRVCMIRRKHYPWQRNVRRNAEALVKAGYEVDVICLGEKGELKCETMNGVNVFRLSLPHHRGSTLWYIIDYAIFFLAAFFKLTRLSLKKRYDAVEVNTMPDFLVFITFLARMRGSKVILYMFENMPGLFMSSYKVGPNHIVTRLLRLMEKLSANYAHHVIVSDGWPYKRILEEHGIPSEKITVVLNVPDDAIFDPARYAVDRNGQGLRLVVVSTLVERYGVQTVVKAIPLLVNEIPELTVDIIGDGEHRPLLEKMARELGIEKHLNFTGTIPYDDVPPYITRADIGLAPMVDDVGLPNKLFEYFALGKPAIASAQPGILESFDNDSCVAFFRPDDEKDLAARVLELYKNPEGKASLVSHANEYYQKYSWPNMKQKYFKVYEDLLTLKR